MGLASPWALVLLLLLPLLWLVRQDPPRRRIVVSARFLWAERPRATPMWGSRPRRHVLVWIQTALLGTLIVALAGPRVESGADSVALVVDASMSMAARDGAGTRLDAARRRAVEALAARHWGGIVRVWAAGATPTLAGTATDGSGLACVLATVTPSDGEGDLQAAIARAEQDSPQPRRIVVVTDQAPLPARDVEWLNVGRAADNLAVTALTVTPDRTSAGRVRLMVEVRNHGAADARTSVAVSAGNRPPSRQVLEVPSRRAAALALELDDVPADTIVSATLEAEDALAADNVRRAIVRGPAVTRIAVEGRSPFLEAALAVHPGVERVASSLDAHDVLLCVDCEDAEHTGSAALLKVVSPRPGGRAVPLTVIRPDHPVIGAVHLDGLDVVPAPGPDAPQGATEVARAGDRPVIIVRDGTPRVVELRLDVADPGLTLQPSFPLLVAAILDDLSSTARPLAIRAGDAFVWRMAHQPDAPPTATGPDGQPIPVELRGNQAVVGGTGTAGVYRIDAGGESVSFVANPATSESDLSAVSPDVRGASRAPETVTTSSAVDLVPALLAAALALTLWEAWVRSALARRAGRQPSWARLAVRGAAVLLVGAALGGLPVWTGTAPLAVGFVVDQSASTVPISRVWLDKARELAGTMEPGDRAGLTVFGEAAVVERQVLEGRLSAGPTESAVAPAGTNVERALQTARAALPATGDRRLVLFSDGRQTSGDALREAVRAAADGVRIDVVTPRPAVSASARATRMTAPAVVRQDEPFAVRILVEGAPGAEGTLQLVGGDEAQTQRIDVPESGAASAVFVQRSATPGLRTYRAAFTPDTPDFAGDGGEPPADVGAVVAVAGRPRILYAGERFGAIAAALAAGGFQASVVPGLAIPAEESLQGYDAVVLDDVDPLALRSEQRTAVARYVDAGGGLLVLGSEAALPPSSGDPAFDALWPVDPRPRSGERGSALALVVAFDKSGSMEERVAGTPKIEFARQAVRNVAAALPPGDGLGVIGFDSAPMTVATMSLERDPGRLDAALRAVRPEGATAIAPALARSGEWLNAPAAGTFARKHVLLISDGQTSTDDLAGARRTVDAGGFVLSVVAVGAGADRVPLEALARASGGRAYFVDDVRALPAAVAREASRVGGGRTVTAGFQPQPGNHPLARGLDDVPPLGGYVVTAARSGTGVVLRSHLDDPVLAVGHSGLGRVAVYTADLHSAWSARLLGWTGFSALLTRTLRWVARAADVTPVHVSLRASTTSLDVEVEIDAGGELAAAPFDVRGVMRSPAGDPSDLTFTAVAPGHYAATSALGPTGAYVASVSVAAADGSLQGTAARGFYYSAPREYDDLGPDQAFLDRLAATTAGRVWPADVKVLDDRRPGYRNGRPWFTTAALLLLFGDLVLAGLPRLTARIRRVGPQEQPA